MLPLLRVRPVSHDRRACHSEPDHADVRRRLGAGHLLVEDRLEAVRGARAAVLLRPRQPHIAGFGEHPAPLPAERIVEALSTAAAAALALGQVRFEPGAQVGPKGGFLGRVAKIHGTLSLSAVLRGDNRR